MRDVERISELTLERSCASILLLFLMLRVGDVSPLPGVIYSNKDKCRLS